MAPTIITETNFADIMGVSKRTLQTWKDKGKFQVHKNGLGQSFFYVKDLVCIPEIKEMVETNWYDELATKPLREYTSVELFAGAGGLALGMSKAGFKHILLNEYDHDACNTLRLNRPDWNIVEQDIHNLDFSHLKDKVDLLTGGFPCQAFSYAGNKGGFNDTRGTLFF